MSIDKSWTTLPRKSQEFWDGLSAFIERCKEHVNNNGLPSYHRGDCGDDPPDGGDQWQPSSGCAASGAKPGKRLKTKNLSLKANFNKNKQQPLSIEFEEGDQGTYIAVGPNSDNFNSLVGTIISKIPYHYHSWKEVEGEHTCTIYEELQAFYDVQRRLNEPGGEIVKAGLDAYFAGIYKGQKYKFGKKYFDKRGGVEKADELRAKPPTDYRADEWEKFVDYRCSERFLKRSRANKANKQKQVIKVRHGRRNLAQIRYDNRDVPPIDLWKNLRSNKKGEFTEAEAARQHSLMVNKKADPRNTSSDDDIVQEVVGDRRGWTRGVGQKLPKSVFARASSSSAQQMYTTDDVRRMFREYTAPLFHKLEITPPPIPFPGNADSPLGEEEDNEDGNENEVTDESDYE